MSQEKEKALDRTSVEAKIIKAFNRGYSAGFADAKKKYMVEDLDIDDILEKNNLRKG